ncbi:MAG: hypothetical protein NZL89_03170 [Leptospiraceae bacterium]|nr:hypothetical protein [Leptospiraceae bacterium]
MDEIALSILHYVYDHSERQIPLAELELQLGRDIHSLRPVIEDLKSAGFIAEEEYRLEILAAGRSFAQSRWA